MRRTAVSVAFAAVSALLLAAMPAAAAPTCSAPTKTLTFECDSMCSNKYAPCWRNASESASATQCPYECYNMYFSDTAQSNFVFLVPFNEKSNKVYAASDAASTDLAKYISKSSDYLSTIDTLVLPQSTTKVSIIGGSFYRLNYIRGRVVTVALASDLVAKQPQVRDVHLASIDLSATVNKLTAMLPLSTKTIDLNNNLITAFPTDFAKFTTLQELSLTNNYITSISAATAIDTVSLLAVNANNVSSFNAVFKNASLVALSKNLLTEYPSVLAQYPRLQTLYLDHNQITTVEQQHVAESVTSLYLGANQITKFNAVFPRLTFLDLRTNNLTAIPPAIFQHPNLTYLNLGDNQFTNVTLTNAQASFFNRLSNFTFDGDVFRDCFVYQQKEVHGTKFCIEDTTDSTGGSSKRSMSIIIGAACGVVVVAAIAFGLWRRARNRREKTAAANTAAHSVTHSNGSASAAAISIWSDPELLAVKVDAADIEDVKVLGKGAFGDVWLVKYRKTQLLASKRLRKSGISPTQTQNFIDEIKLVAKLEHPNIVAFVGAAWTIQSDLQALFEFMDGGDLRDYLTNKQTPRTWTPEKLQIAIDIAEALVYVHSFAPPLVHRDLKSRNVLLGSSGSADNDGSRDGTLHAKLTDFGVSRFRSEDNTMTSGVGTGKWLAPEVITGATDYGAPADIFSFGAVLTEIDTHALPYDDVVGPNGAKLADVALLQLVASGEARPQFSSKCPAEIAELGERCFALDSTARPVAAEIAYALRQLKKRTHKVL